MKANKITQLKKILSPQGAHVTNTGAVYFCDPKVTCEITATLTCMRFERLLKKRNFTGYVCVIFETEDTNYTFPLEIYQPNNHSLTTVLTNDGSRSNRQSNSAKWRAGRDSRHGII